MGVISNLGQFIKKRVVKFVLRTVVLLFGLLFAAILLLQIPAVQTYFVTKITNKLSEVTNHKTTIDYVNVSWFDEAYIEGIAVYDVVDSTMFSASEITFNFDLWEIITTRNIKLDRVEIQSGSFHMIKHSDELPLNLTQFLDEVRKMLASDGPPKEKKPIRIGEIDIWNSSFKMDDYRSEIDDFGIDPGHLSLLDINLSVHDFRLIYDSIDFHITSLSVKEAQDKLIVEKLNSNFALTSKSLEFSNLYAKTSRSEIKDYLKFEFSTISNLSYFTDSVSFEFNFDNSSIHTDDVSQFSPALRKYHEQVKIGGHYYGSVKNFQGEYMLIDVGDNTLIKGNCFVTGLPNVKETFMEFRIGKSTIDPEDLKFILPVDSLPLNDIGRVRLDGTFLGFPTDFVAKANFVTRSGSISTDINFKLKGGPTKSEYRGQLSTSNLDIGKFVGPDEVLDGITMNGKIEGTGITPESAIFELESTINEFVVQGYPYSNIYIDGHFESGFFEGKLNVDDPNVGLNLDGTIDIRKGQEQILGQATLNHFRAKELNLTNTDLEVSSEIDISLNGLTIDDIAGYVDLHELDVRLGKENLLVDSLKISSLKVDENRLLTVETDGLKAEVNGTYKTSELINDLSRLYKEYKLQLINEESEIESYYKVANADNREYEVEFNLSVDKANKFLNPFVENSYISENVEFSGGFLHNSSSNLTLYGFIDSLSFNGNSMKNTTFELNTSKINGAPDVLAMMYVSSDKQYWGKDHSSDELEFEVIWSDQMMDLFIQTKQPELDNHATLKANVEFLQDTTNVKFLPSDIAINNEVWTFSNENELLLLKDRVLVNNFQISTQEQIIGIDGFLSDSSDLKIQLKDLKLDPVSIFIDQEVKGVSNGELALNGPMSDLFATGDFQIDSLTIDDFLVGDLDLETKWDDLSKVLKLNTGISRDAKDIVDVHGNIFFREDSKELALKASLSGVELQIVEPFFKEHISNLEGSTSGDFVIRGTTVEPDVFGSGKVQSGSVILDYLKTKYRFNGDYELKKDSIVFERVQLTDINDHNAYFRGSIVHDGFKDLRLSVNGDMFNFNVLNTTSRDNSLYYGQANATGSLSFLGPLNNLKISAKAKTDKNSKLFVPLTDNSSADLKDYITFVDLMDTVEVKDQKNDQISADLSGIELDLELEVTEDAYFELIFDLKAGDIIRGRGNGNMKIQINTEGDFNMVGDYEISQGGYNFTLYNIINKEFEIRKGSKISWYGDPYKAVLDIKADYRQNILYSPILTGLSDEALNDPQLRRRYPAIVVLELSDEMLNPEIDFDIEFENYPQQSIRLNDGTSLNYTTFLEPFLFKIQNDEQELKRQVFSLLILRKLSPENSFDVAGQTIGNSVSEFISNQLSYWISQVDENLEIDVDLSTLDQDAFDTFQLRLSYTFLNGRLRVSRLGGITNYSANTAATNAGFSNIIGDLSVEYLLTSDGRLRAKMYSRNQNDDQLEQGFETGVSLQYVRTFDYMQEIWKKNRSKKTKFVDASGNVVESTEDKKRNKKKSEK